MKKIAFITTVRHNVGDDFVREGILHLLHRRFPGDALKVENIHKHAPVTVRRGFERVRRLRSSKILDFLPVRLTRDRILEADLLVQAGAPVYWCHDIGGGHCADNEWFRPLILKRYQKIRAKAPFINLAAGTCQRYHSDGSEFLKCEKDMKYIREIHSISKITTVRDKLSKSLLNSLGLDAPLIPCSSIFARDRLRVDADRADFVALNYMRGGAHYTFGQNVDAGRWERAFREFYLRLRGKERCVFVCHNSKEAEEARKISSDAEIFLSADHEDYVRLYSRAKFGIVNRVHAAFVIASYGRPSFVVGNDSRARMVEEIGLRHAYVDDVDAARLIAEYDDLKSGADSFSERFRAIRQKAYNDYMKALFPLA